MNGDQVSENLIIESIPARGNRAYIPFNKPIKMHVAYVVLETCQMHLVRASGADLARRQRGRGYHPLLLLTLGGGVVNGGWGVGWTVKWKLNRKKE